mgnify:CR=1 FL=1
MSERAVRVIPPTINIATHLPKTSARKRRVAAYARVPQTVRSNSPAMKHRWITTPITYRKIRHGNLQECIRMRGSAPQIPGIVMALIG